MAGSITVEIEEGGVVVAASSSDIGSEPKLQHLSVDKLHRNRY